MALPLAGAKAQPQVPGATTSVYATVTDPLALSFGADGALYAGRDNSGSGGGPADAVKIHRIGPGGSPVTEFGNAAIADPDAVIVDRTGAITGLAGAVLVGGQTQPGIGQVSRVAPDGTITALFGPSSLYNNPSGFAFDSLGRLLFTESAQGRVYRAAGGAPTLLFNLADAWAIASDATDRIVVGLASTGKLLLYSTNGVRLNDNFATVRAGTPLVRGPGGFWTTELYAITTSSDLIRIALDGTTTTMGSGFGDIEGLTFGADGAIYASDFAGDRVWRIAPLVAPPPFTFTTTTVPVGDSDSGPDCLATADVNGDGRLDLISANYGFRWALPGDPGGWNTNVVVLTNNGSGGFTLSATLTVGAGPASVVAVDVNGDGRPDVISANQTANTLTVLTNNGSGFSLLATIPASGAPTSLVAVDVNGDWALDLAYVSSGANTVTVLTNNGRGLFTSQGAFAVGPKPIFLVTTDVNGDARPDLVSVNHDANSLTVLTNDGSGFGFNATLPVGSIPVAAAAGDVNRDGRPDLVAVNWGANTLTVLTNHGAGSFSTSATLSVGTTPSSAAVGDFNGDGAADLICANTSAGAGNSLTVYTNSGSGSFGLQATLPLGNIPTSLLAADVNSDGRLDANFLNFRDGTLTVLLNTTLFPPTFSSLTLDISRKGGGMRVAWPSAAPGWSLQQKRALTAPNWLPSGHDGYPFTDDQTNKSLTLPATNAGLFFRLFHP